MSNCHENQLNPRQWLLLGGLMTAALLMRIGGWYWDPAVSRDGVLYLEIIEELRAHPYRELLLRMPWVWIPPLYLQCAAWGMALGISAENSAVFLNVISGFLLVPGMFWLGCMLFRSMECAFFAAALTAFHPALIDLSHQVQRENFFLLFALLALGMAVSAELGRQYWRSIIVGLALVLAFLCRFEAVEIFFLVEGIWTWRLWRKTLSWRGWGLMNLGALAGCCLGAGLTYAMFQTWVYGGAQVFQRIQYHLGM